MAVHYLRYTFVRKVDVYELDPAYQDSLTKNQLQKVFGPYNLSEMDRLEIMDENKVTEDSEVVNIIP